MLVFLQGSALPLILLAFFQKIDESQVKFFLLSDSEPEKGYVWFILSAFYLVGVALAVTIIIGVAAGAFRVWLMTKYPNNRFNGSPKAANVYINLSD